MLFERLRQALGDGGGCALLILDLDGFKGLNDTFGHRAGDRVLRELAVRMKHAADPDALVARLAGDEFGVLITGPERARAATEAARMLGAFLPVTEDTDLICRLTDEVLDLALADLARWRESRPAVRLAVNISSLDMRDPSLHDRVSEALVRHDAPAEALTLEITENALIVARDAALVGGLIRMGHDLGPSVVAEGVETEAGASALRALGCDLLQGYLVGRPGPWRSLGESPAAPERPAAATLPAVP